MAAKRFMSFVQCCRKDGVYADKSCKYRFKIKSGEVYRVGLDGSWERLFGNFSLPNKKRFLTLAEAKRTAV